MKLDGGIEIDASPRAVWELIIDPVSLAFCVAGVQDVARVDDRTFRGVITASVGPIEGRFTFTSTIERNEFPTALEVLTVGTDSVTNSPLKAVVTAWLESPSADRTVLGYRADVTVGGRLAILGEMVLRATAGVLIGQLVVCLRARLETSPSGAGA